MLEPIQTSHSPHRRSPVPLPPPAPLAQIRRGREKETIGSGVCRRTEVARRMQNITTPPTPSCETELRLRPMTRFRTTSRGWRQMRGRVHSCMYVDWLRFGGRSILGHSKRSRREIYGFTTVERTDGMRSVISDLHHRCLKRGLRHERISIVQQAGHN